MVGCLDESTVLAFAEGRLEPEAMLTANSHARGCASCHDRLVHALQLSFTGGTMATPLSPAIAPRGGDDTLAKGTSVGRYTVLVPVGRGGMGQVYSAYDPQLDRRVALKLLHVEASTHDPRAQDRLLREAQSIARLSHPNVVVVHDVGTFGERVFVAMEFVDGATLAAWRQEKARTWKEILHVYLAAARGLAAAHRAGLVHRDFKPQNVMVSVHGAVRVMDFGLARRLDGAPDGAPDADAPAGGSAPTPTDLSLTRPGERLGTPRYMAPEQFRNEAVDERSDQFAFCVALYEALYGAHPFEDDSFLSLSFSVTAGELRALPKDRDVPAWLRRAVLRGLSVRPSDRHASMAAVVSALEADPAVGRRRRLVAAGLVGLAAASLLVARQMVTHRRAELDRRVSLAVADAEARAHVAHEQAAAALKARADAYAAFDARADAQGEELWRRAQPLGPEADATYVQAERAFETALLLDSTRADARDRRLDVLLEHHALAEEVGLDERARALAEQLEHDDPRGPRLAALRAPGTVAVRVAPATAALTLERYEVVAVTLRRVPHPAPAIARGESQLPPGSYRLALSGPGLAETFVPFVAERGRRIVLDVTVPAADAVPKGFVYVPAGDFLYGDEDEKLRTEFLRTVPLHRRHANAFLIARTETTFREYVTFLETLPPKDRGRLAPNNSAVLRGSIQLRELPGAWELTFQPSSRRYVVRTGELIEYEGRRKRARQDWLDFPAGGIADHAVMAYLAWLGRTGRVPGARLCTELEWERAARGADDRVFPHGDSLVPDDANFDGTYDHVPPALGPDVVGAHPLSRSPFGLDDLAGSLFEFVLASQGPEGFIIRGGAYYFSAATCRSTNRDIVPRSFHDVTSGLRVCAPPPAR